MTEIPAPTPEIITVVVRTHPPKGQIFYYEPPTQIFTGALVPNPEWVANDCITITGDRWCPLRIIPKRDIVEGIAASAPTPYANEDLVCNVSGSKGTPYVVNRTANIWSCTCMGFAYRKDCKHIRQVKDTYLAPTAREV